MNPRASLAAFIAWAQRYVPEVFAADPRMKGTQLGDASGATDATVPAWLQGLKVVADAYVTNADRRDLFKMNADRAAQGLPPIDGSGNPVASAIGSPMFSQWLTVGAVLLGVYWVVGALAPRKRR